MAFVEGPSSSFEDVSARPWHFGSRVVTGPAYEASGFVDQMDHPDAVNCIIVRPGHNTLKEWAKSCMAIEEYAGEDHFGGWSPGRSVEVQVAIAEGTEEHVETYYYKLFDFNSVGVDIDPAQTGPLPDPLAWVPVWQDFIHISIRLLLINVHRFPPAAAVDRMVLEMIGRELTVWNGDILTMTSAALGNPSSNAAASQAFMVQWSRNCFWARVRSLARLGVAEVFLLWPQMVLVLLGH